MPKTLFPFEFINFPSQGENMTITRKHGNDTVACKIGFVLFRPKKIVSTDHLSHFWRLTPWLVRHPVYSTVCTMALLYCNYRVGLEYRVR
jgi:hypothetical protein